MFRILVTFILIFFTAPSFGQYAENIASGRPGQAIGARTLGESVFQLQSGFSRTQFPSENFQISNVQFNNVLRLGITERFELSGVVNWQSDKNQILNESNTVSGISDTQLGGRYTIVTNEGWRPAIALQGRILLNLQSEAFRMQNLGARFILAMGNSLTEKFSLSTNWILGYKRNGGRPSYGYVINLGYGITDRLSTFVEVFGALNDIDIDIDAGFAFLMNKDLQLDFSFGTLSNGNTTSWFADAGLSWRFDWRSTI
ncbi:hypothetical protein MTsPCn5_38010 [Croceitalea sp. MTPC5]|uniref:transporter n=1 Tax=Croceitalea sp. MTPC5 TaxID=3056565 RepID=UPI002B37A3A3|nr:hypothetical protein MTsPCn5_38010 [Croceitalea sp. MTPC5]